MVAERTTAETDQVPEENTQTESVEENLPAVAAEENQEAAVVEAEKPLTREEAERMWQEREATLRQQTAEQIREEDRRQRQSEEGRKAAEASQRVKLRDAVSVSLVKNLGITDLDDEVADDLINRVRGVEADIVAESTSAAYDEAISAAAAKAVGLTPQAISPQAQRYMGKLTRYMEQLLAHDVVREYIARDAKRVWEAELPKIVDAEIAKRGGGKAPLARPETQVTKRSDDEILADPNTPIQILTEIRARQKAGS